MHSLTTVDFLLRLATGVGCGALIGVERQWRARMAALQVRLDADRPAPDGARQGVNRRSSPRRLLG
jgi:hypothetical protein